MSNRHLSYAVLAAALLLASLTAFDCGNNSPPATSSAPVISNLQYSPQSAFLNDGDGLLTIYSTVDFKDADGDVTSFTVQIFDSTGNLSETLTSDITGASGIREGTGSAMLLVNTGSIGSYNFRLFMTDGMGHESNVLEGIFPIRGPVQTTSLLPDSGIRSCYNDNGIIACPEEGMDFYGQDFLYTAHPMSFTDNGDGTVMDDVTGLLWQQDAGPPTFNWYEASGTFDATQNPSALDVCAAAGTAGLNGWRLPTRDELASIVDYGRGMPAAVNTDVFPNANFEYWTLTNSAVRAGYVDFSTGSVFTADKSLSKYVRCTRGPEWGGNAFTNNGNGTVSDARTGLMWQVDTQGNLDWHDMIVFCDSLDLAGHTDWRLPDIRELASIIDAEAHLTINQGIYCSSTTDVDNAANVWMVQFYPNDTYGDVFLHGAGYGKQFCSSFYFRCVR